MALRDPREVESAVTELRAKIEATLADNTIPEQDRRDAVMRMTGEVSALEVQARELRDHEVEELKRAVSAGSPVEAKDKDAERVSAFRNFIKTGEVNNAALQTTPDANGGYLLPNPIRQQIIDVVRASNPIVELATVITLDKPGTFSVELPRKASATAGGWVGETDARPATDAPTIDRAVLNAYEWYANPEVTQSFIDSVAGAEQFLIDDIAATFTATFGAALASGDGSGKPDGLFTGSSVYTTKTSSTADSLDAQQILDAYFALPGRYLPNAVWVANGATVAALCALVWPNMADTPLVDFNDGSPRILGKRVVVSDDAPAIGSGNFPLAFGDISQGYVVGIHSNLSTLRDPFTNKPYVGFYSTGRAGGTFWDPNAVLLLKSDDA